MSLSFWPSDFSSFHLFTKIVLILGATIFGLLLLGSLWTIIRIIGSKKQTIELRPREDLLDKIELNSPGALQEYILAGHHKRDREMLASKNWWEVLDALLALDITLPRLSNDKEREELLEVVQTKKSDRQLVQVVLAKIILAHSSITKAEIFLDKFDVKHSDEAIVLDAVLESFELREALYINYLYTRPNTPVSKVILKACMRKKSKSAKKAIKELFLSDKVVNKSNLKSLIKAVGELRVKSAAAKLERLINSKDSKVACAALFSLSLIDGDKYNRYFFRKLAKSEMEMPKDVFDVLSYLSFPTKREAQ